MDETPTTHVGEALRHSRALRTEAVSLCAEVRAAADEAGQRLDLERRMDRNPYLTLLAAAGVGYVLGGGLFARFTGRVLRLATRIMLLPILRNELFALGTAVAEGAIGTRGDGPLASDSGAEDGNGGL